MSRLQRLNYQLQRLNYRPQRLNYRPQRLNYRPQRLNYRGKRVNLYGTNAYIIGVFDDYVWDSPYKSNNPQVVFLNPKQTGTITMRLNNANSLQSNIETISRIAKV
ncbi:hypothetical protein, partial [Pedobacter sp. AJM]|uniref:hypothetical protein n=1 Tax=Pedobacter sp. AJM TaxID=2003629 RepID=UPI001124E37D